MHPINYHMENEGCSPVTFQDWPQASACHTFDSIRELSECRNKQPIGPVRTTRRWGLSRLEFHSKREAIIVTSRWDLIDLDLVNRGRVEKLYLYRPCNPANKIEYQFPGIDVRGSGITRTRSSSLFMVQTTLAGSGGFLSRSILVCSAYIDTMPYYR